MHVTRTLASLALLSCFGRATSAQVKLEKRYQLDMDGAVRIQIGRAHV